MNRFSSTLPSLAYVAAALLFAVQAQGAPVAYPFKGQSPQQQQRDDGECYLWSKNKTQIDPAAVAAAPAPPAGPAVGGGERVAGAARGAIVGGAIDGSDGARTGAGVGVVAGGARARQKQQSQQASAQAQKQGALDTFYRAYGACMEGRGYTVR
jgi:hypothetical protein